MCAIWTYCNVNLLALGNQYTTRLWRGKANVVVRRLKDQVRGVYGKNWRKQANDKCHSTPGHWGRRHTVRSLANVYQHREKFEFVSRVGMSMIVKGLFSCAVAASNVKIVALNTCKVYTCSKVENATKMAFFSASFHSVFDGIKFLHFSTVLCALAFQKYLYKHL